MFNFSTNFETNSPVIFTCIAISKESALQRIALCCLHLVLHLVGNVESIDVQQAIQGTQVCTIQGGHGETDLQVLAVELHPCHLRDIVLGEREDAVGWYLKVIRVVHVLRKLKPAEHVQLGQVHHNGHIRLALRRHIGRIDYPHAFDGRGESVREIGRLDVAMACL